MGAAQRDSASATAPALHVVPRCPLLQEALLDALPPWRFFPTPEAQYLLRLMVSFPHLPCRDRVGGWQQLLGWGTWGRGRQPSVICCQGPHRACSKCSLVPKRLTPIVPSFLDLSHAGMVLGVKSQLWSWHWSLLGRQTSCADLLPVARMFPALSLLTAFARAVPPECPSSCHPVATVFFLLISLGCPHNCCGLSPTVTLSHLSLLVSL